MKHWQIGLLACAVALMAFQTGYRRGMADCPEATRIEQERQIAIDRDIEALMKAPSGRELVCEHIFNLVTDTLDLEALDDQAERARTPKD